MRLVEVLLLVLVGSILLRPKKLPELAEAIGKAIRAFRKEWRGDDPSG